MKLNFVLSYCKDGKNFATTAQCGENANLLPIFESWQEYKQLGELTIIHFVGSKKKAEELARHWNECYKNNGTLNTVYCGGSL